MKMFIQVIQDTVTENLIKAGNTLLSAHLAALWLSAKYFAYILFNFICINKTLYVIGIIIITIL